MPSIPDRAPRDFSAILGAAELPLIVGGQAVNLWADLYAPEVPALEEFRPFVSKDADIYGTRALAEQLARRAGWEMGQTERVRLCCLRSAWAVVDGRDSSGHEAMN